MNTLTADQILSAIGLGQLASRLIVLASSCNVEILINGLSVAALGCHRLGRPMASSDRADINVLASSGLAGGFSIVCKSANDAKLIADALNRCFETSFLDLVDPDR